MAEVTGFIASAASLSALADVLGLAITRTTHLLDNIQSKRPQGARGFRLDGDLRLSLKLLSQFLKDVQYDRGSGLPSGLATQYVQDFNRFITTLQRVCDILERAIKETRAGGLKAYLLVSKLERALFRLSEDLQSQTASLRPLRLETVEEKASAELRKMPGYTSLLPIYLAHDSNVDIIFVHGLNGNQTRTWQMNDVPRSREVFWPKDFLPAAFPRANIYTYGYDYLRNPSIKNSISDENTLEDIGKDLLLAIQRRMARDTSGGSIIWVAHSFGGLVVKSALTLSRKFIWADPHGSVYNATSGLIFLGTPHISSTDAAWRETLARIAEVTDSAALDGRSIGTRYLSEMELDRLGDSNTEFASVISKKGLPIFSFFESIPTNTQAGPVLITDFSSAMGTFSETVKFLEGDHLTLCKFQDPSEPGYLSVKRAINQIQESSIGMHSTAVSLSPSNSEQKSSQYNLDENASIDLSPSSLPNLRRKFQKSLDVSWMERKIIPPQDSGSCKWISDMPNFKTWRKQSVHDNKKKFLHITGPPGCGKSTLTNYIIDILEKNVEDKSLPGHDHKSPAVLYFFFELKQRIDFAIHDLLKIFLSQLLDLNPRYMRHVPTSRIDRKTRYQAMQGWASRPSAAEDVEELTEILLAMLRDPNCDSIYCIIDGVDECDEASTMWLLSLLDQLLLLPNCKLLLTSVPAIHIKKNLGIQSVPGLTEPIKEWMRSKQSQILPLDIVDSKGFAEDFNMFLKPRLNELVMERDIPRGVRTSLENTLLRGREYGYVWVMLVLQILATKPSIRSVKIFLDEAERKIPDLKSIYSKIFTDIGQEINPNSLAGSSIFESIYSLRYALRPLSIQDLAIRLSMRQDPKNFEELFDNKPLGLDRYLKKILGNLLRFDNGIVSFINSTCKRFIDEDGLPNDLPSHRSSDVHLDMARSCVRLLHLKERQSNKLKVHQDPYDTNIPFMKYAMSCWDGHLRAAGELACEFDTHLSQIWESNERRLFYQFQPRPKAAQNDTLLSALVKLDLPYNASTLMSKDPISGAELKGHIEYATRYCSEQMVTMLVKQYKRIGLELGSLNSTLQTRLRTEELINAIQKVGINAKKPPTEVLNASDLPTEAKSLIICAAIKWKWRSPDFVKLILQSPSLSMESGFQYQLPLCEAIKFQALPIVELVLEYCRPEQIGDCLHLAVGMASLKLCHCLISAGANIEARNEKRETPLQTAVVTGQQEIVEFLIDSGADPFARDIKGRLPLHRAARMGQTKIVEILLEITGQTEAEDKEGRSPMFVACSTGMEEVVYILLRYGADVSSKTNVGRTPLHAAVNGGCEGVVKLLLQNGSDPNSADFNRYAPLHEASSLGYESIARMLLLAGADPCFQTVEGMAPLHYACSSESYPETLIKNLLEAGATPGQRDKRGKLPLHYAAELSIAAIVVQMSNYSALVDTRDEDGNTPLHIACMSESARSLSISKALVNSGADFQVKNKGKQSALWYAEQHSWGGEFISWVKKEHKGR